MQRQSEKVAAVFLPTYDYFCMSTKTAESKDKKKQSSKKKQQNKTSNGQDRNRRVEPKGGLMERDRMSPSGTPY